MSEPVSALLEIVQQKALEAEQGSSWIGYAAILRYVTTVHARLPSVEVCDEDGMERILEAELEHLASAVTEVFPGQGPVELAYYVPEPQRQLIE